LVNEIGDPQAKMAAAPQPIFRRMPLRNRPANASGGLIFMSDPCPKNARPRMSSCDAAECPIR
jgi:hypothetical protein